jgi:hypothetical protein
MSLINRVVMPFVAVLGLAFLVGCGSSSSTATPPPTGGFSNNNLNGTYVFSVSGIDVNQAPYAIVGTFTASGGTGNGTASISGGTIDVNDAAFTNSIPNSAVGNGSIYSVGVDGRGQIKLNTSTPFGTILLDFVLQNSSHGLVTQFDGDASGSGTIDAQTAGVTPNGPYAFNFAGADFNTGNPFAMIGNFTVGANGTIASGSGTEDSNDDGTVLNVNGEALTGTVVAGPSSTPSTVLTAGGLTRTYDVFPIDAAHLKFIEMDANGILSGDAFAQTSTAFPNGTLAFTLAGALPLFGATAAGGFLVTDGNGNITDASTEDFNEGGNPSANPVTITASYSGPGNGRFVVNNFSGNFVGGTEFVAYPFSNGGNGGLFLLQIVGGGVMSGSASLQTAGATLAASQGYGLNFTGVNVTNSVEVDDIAEFQTTTTTCGAATGSSIVSGLVDENAEPGNTQGGIANQVLCGNYSTPDSTGRGQIATVTANNTLNTGFQINYYTVDGTTFPFIETDNGGQVSVGVFVQQDASGASSKKASKSSSMFVAHPLVRPHAGSFVKK